MWELICLAVLWTSGDETLTIINICGSEAHYLNASFSVLKPAVLRVSKNWQLCEIVCYWLSDLLDKQNNLLLVFGCKNTW